MSSYKFILGLNFILGHNGSMLITPSGVNFFKKSTFIQPKLETSNIPYIKKISNIEKPIDLEYFDSLLEDSIVNLELEPEQVLSYEEIDEYLMESYTEDICVVSKIESNQENIEENSWPIDIKNKIKALEKTKIIGDNPVNKNSTEVYKLEIINPDITIITQDLAYSLEDRKECKMHIEELLALGVIRESTSRHRSPAFIVSNHSEQKRGKSRMVINYKRLNDNTLRNSYKLPNKDELVNCIQKATWFSKFDCKSGFWQIKLDEESIPWTAFSCSEGHFEWLVMPFGLKNAPQVFQARMDRIFKKISNFCIVFIDDILVFSNNRYVHTSHVHKIHDLCK